MSASRVHAAVEMSGGRARFSRLSAGRPLRPRPMEVHGCRARLALLSTYAMLLDGDDLEIHIEVEPGAILELIEPSGTVAYDMRGGSARWSMHVEVASGAQLLWRGSPFVVSAGADLMRHLQVDVAAGGHALVSELLMLGRSYEAGAGPVRSSTRASYAGEPVLVEDLDLRSLSLRDSPGVMGANRAMASVLLLGDRPEEVHGRHETRLAGTGALARALATDAHLAEEVLEPTWARWSARLVAAEPSDPGPAAPSSPGPHRSDAGTSRSTTTSVRALSNGRS